MKIIIDNVIFGDFDTGLKILKLKYQEIPEQFLSIKKQWDSTDAATFADVAQLLNVEQRRVGMQYIPIESLQTEIKPVLISSETIPKTTEWLVNGKAINHSFEDTYELYKVSEESMFKDTEHQANFGVYYYLSFKDASTSRKYMLWVDLNHVRRVNDFRCKLEEMSPIACIAWTFMTTIEKGGIEAIFRHGDLLLYKLNKEHVILKAPRHLTEEEYRNLLKHES